MNLKTYLQDKSQQSFADKVGVSQMMVSHWVRETKKITGDRVIQICRVAGWAVTPFELRPDIYPHPNDGLPEHLRKLSVVPKTQDPLPDNSQGVLL